MPTLDQHIGVRIPGGQPKSFNHLQTAIDSLLLASHLVSATTKTGSAYSTNHMWIAALVLQHSLTLYDRDAHSTHFRNSRACSGATPAWKHRAKREFWFEGCRTPIGSRLLLRHEHLGKRLLLKLVLDCDTYLSARLGARCRASSGGRRRGSMHNRSNHSRLDLQGFQNKAVILE